MSNVTERMRKLEEELLKDSLRIKKLERYAETTQGFVLLLIKAIVISVVTAVFMQTAGISLADNILAALVPGIGFFALELVERFYKARYGRRT